MSTQQTVKEETDVVDLYQLIKKVIYKIFHLFLRFINFLIRNIIIIAILIIAGVVLGYFLDKNSQKIYKTEFIVATDFDAAEYLYKSIEELKFGFKNYNDPFFEELGIPKEEALKINLNIEPIVVIDKLTKEEEAYADFLKDDMEPQQREHLFINSVKRHKITLYHPETINAERNLTKIIEYIRENDYYQDLYTLYAEETKRQLNGNINLVNQIDSLVVNYSHSFKREDLTQPQATYFNSGTVMDLGVVLENRTLIQEGIAEILEKKVSNSEFLRILDKGSRRDLETFSLSSRKIILYPIVLVLLFIAIKIFRVVYRKSKQQNR